ETPGLRPPRAVRSSGLGANRMVERAAGRSRSRIRPAHARTRSGAHWPDGADGRRLAGQADRPEGWLQESTTPSVPIEGNVRYGWHWYLGELAIGAPSRTERLISGVGWGGQRLFLVPAFDLVVAMNAGNYRKPGAEQRRVANAVLTELVLPNIT